MHPTTNGLHLFGVTLIGAFEERYGIGIGDIDPKVYWRLTDNWVELSMRFVVPDQGTRSIKDAISREVLSALDAAGIGIASATSEVTITGPVTVRRLD